MHLKSSAEPLAIARSGDQISSALLWRRKWRSVGDASCCKLEICSSVGDALIKLYQSIPFFFFFTKGKQRPQATNQQGRTEPQTRQGHLRTKPCQLNTNHATKRLPINSATITNPPKKTHPCYSCLYKI